MRFQVDHKKWAENSLETIKTESYDTIQSWSRSYDIKYYIGSISCVYYSKGGALEINLLDYDGISHELYFHYDLDETSSWNQGIDEIYEVLSSGKKCVMAVAAAVQYNNYERVFSYNYTYEE